MRMRPNRSSAPASDVAAFARPANEASAHLTARNAAFPARARASLDAYFAAQQLSAAALDKTLRDRFGADVDPFFVSTIVRGLAGSTSDIDVIAVGGEASQAMSTMIFWEGRRIGVKLVDRARLAAAFTDLRTTARRIADGAFVVPAELSTFVHLKRVDLERLINGYSLSAGTPYLDHLPALSAVTALENLREAAVTLTAAAWAGRCGSLARVRAYLTAFTINAMDAVMARAGEVQSNTKWTAQRWQAFRAEAACSSVPEPIVLVDQLVAGLADGRLREGGAALVANARAVLEELAPASAGSERQVLTPAPGVARFPFMPGADCLIGDAGCVVVDTARLHHLLSTSSLAEFDAEEAHLALDLVSRSALRIDTVASHGGSSEAAQ